jgi:hypothetical protein
MCDILTLTRDYDMQSQTVRGTFLMSVGVPGGATYPGKA